MNSAATPPEDDFDRFRIVENPADKRRALDFRSRPASVLPGGFHLEDGASEAITRLVPLTPRTFLPSGRSTRMEEDERSRAIPSSYLRIIQQEIDSGNLDLRIVMNECMGLTPGTKKFNSTYYEARLQALLSRKNTSGVQKLPAVVPADGATAVVPAEQSISNPFIIIFPSQLLKHYGFWILAIGALEAWNSWKIGGVLDSFLHGGHPFLSMCVLFLLFMVNTFMWFRLRGKHASRFVVPVLATLLVNFLVACGFHLVQAATLFDSEWNPGFRQSETFDLP